MPSVTPVAKSVFLCDDLVRDDERNKTSILNLFDTVRAAAGEEIPVHLAKLVRLFCEKNGRRSRPAFASLRGQLMKPGSSTNPEAYGSTAIFAADCDVQYPPFAPAPATSPTTLPPAVRLILDLAAENLPQNERTLIKLFLDGKSKQEVAAALGVTFPDLYYLWQGAYRRTRAFLESHSAIDANVKHGALVAVSELLNGRG